eukprot:gb/GEZJ01005711.1/.p4 GENE.gb/GEZJ01005711.1/~~gb/GEZJ01005711.1/.p4  ORF type:complete len:105 (-),score=11.80 gb/GEZJ01005711.1/:1765-2079(-)
MNETQAFYIEPERFTYNGVHGTFDGGVFHAILTTSKASGKNRDGGNRKAQRNGRKRSWLNSLLNPARFLGRKASWLSKRLAGRKKVLKRRSADDAVADSSDLQK